MPRRARLKSDTGFYHVYQRGNDKQVIFEDDLDRREYLSVLAKALERYELRLLAWCLMTNHVHLLVDDPHDHLTEAMHLVGTLYAQHFIKRWSRVGHVFQGRFSSEPIRDEAHLLEAFRYIHNNPALASLAAAESYEWSSYDEYVGRVSRGLCDTTTMLDILSGEEGFRQFVAERSPINYYFEGGGKLSDSQASAVARYVLGERDVASLKRLRPRERKPLVQALIEAGISVKQLERMTGLSRGSLYAS